METKFINKMTMAAGGGQWSGMWNLKNATKDNKFKWLTENATKFDTKKTKNKKATEKWEIFKQILYSNKSSKPKKWETNKYKNATTYLLYSQVRMKLAQGPFEMRTRVWESWGIEIDEGRTIEKRVWEEEDFKERRWYARGGRHIWIIILLDLTSSVHSRWGK